MQEYSARRQPAALPQSNVNLLLHPGLHSYCMRPCWDLHALAKRLLTVALDDSTSMEFGQLLRKAFHIAIGIRDLLVHPGQCVICMHACNILYTHAEIRYDVPACACSLRLGLSGQAARLLPPLIRFI